jgi:Zn-dependent peptidase ImmA (M78 family)
MSSKSESEAKRVLADQGVRTIPVPVESIARKLGATISYRPFDGELSGMLFRGDDGAMKLIGVNSSHAKTRQRFTVAHELGHLLLHKGRPMILDAPGRVNLRDATSGQATDNEEIEANAFAAELLMPGDRVTEEFKKRMHSKRAPSLEAVVSELALRFDVSAQAMQYRLVNLQLALPG